MDIHVVTDVDQLDDFVEGWESLVDVASLPRAGGGIVAAWAREMMSPEVTLRIWIATDGSEVVGVLPFVSETMTRERLRFLPAATDMMFGAVPVAHPDRDREVAEFLVADFAQRSQSIELASLFWLAEDSPWQAAFGRQLFRPEWVCVTTSRYSSYYSNIVGGLDGWLGRRNKVFRQGTQRRARRAADLDFRLFTTVRPDQIQERLSRLQTFYLARKEARGGEGYRFDDAMVKAIATAAEISPAGRFALSLLEKDDQVIGMYLALRAGKRMSGWLTGYDPEFSRLGPGIATMAEALDAGARAGCEFIDLGVGDESYKDDLQDAAFPLESLTWCRPRLARLLQLHDGARPNASGDEDGEATETVS